MAPLQHEAYTFDPRPRFPFLITAKRYWNTAYRQSLDDADAEDTALTVVFAHATGYHKEHWEPTIEDLYDVVQEAGSGNAVKIREFWCIDAPNHGDAAVLNDELLSWGHTPVFDWQEYARSIHAVLAGLGTGIDVDFRSRKLVGVGHSMGAVSIMLADTYMPEVKFQSIILVDPMFYSKGRPKLDLISLSSKRRDIWPSYEEAYNQLKSRSSYQAWDPRILKIYVKHGLRDLPSVTYLDKQGVTLKCTKEQELACYRETVAKARAYTYLSHMCARLPVHFIFGAINDFVSTSVQDDLLSGSAKGQYATVQRIPECGHLIPQLKPKKLAEAIYATLQSDCSRNFSPGPAARAQSKL
ncbi:Alpha/beta hydrolase family-domain-containing protein [Cytidiella melzeri]|nr:Alpha/beta hydrolase family-domain-containing protein [Cytidiella melzeri]